MASEKIINPQALSHYIMGVLCDDLGDVESAIKEYRKALLTDNEAMAIRLNLAISLIRKNELPEAEKELRRLIKLYPKAIEPHVVLAILYSAQDKVDLAMSEYESALKEAANLNPKDIDIYRGLGSLYLKQKKLKEAENVYRIISALSPADPQAHFYLAVVYDELKKPDLCEEELNKTLKLSPEDPEALNYLGYKYAEWNKNLNQAERLIKKALSLEPDNGAYIDSLGWVYFKKASFKQAKYFLEKAASLLEDPVIYDHLGDVYFKLREIEKAKSSWQKSWQLDPKQDSVKNKIEALNKNAGNAHPN